MADTFLSDTEAPSLGLYLVKTPNGIAYEVKRASDDEFLFCGDRAQVRLFLRGYAAAQGQEPRLLVLWRDVEPQVSGRTATTMSGCRLRAPIAPSMATRTAYTGWTGATCRRSRARSWRLSNDG